MDIPPFRLERYLARHEFSAPFLLCTSDCETMSVRELLGYGERSMEEFADLRLGYTESQGNPGLREEIASLYEDRDPDSIIVTAGAEEGIFIAMQTLLSPGDHAVIQTPAYQSLTEIPSATGCTVSAWDLVFSDGEWRADFDRLHSLIRKDTSLIAVNSPHNPTGYQFSHDEWKELAEISESSGITLLADEVYRGMERSPRDRLACMADMTSDGISIGVMSKAFGLAGLRIGWIAADDRDFLDRFQAYKDYTTICSSGPSEFLATVALQNRDTILARNQAIIRDNLDLLNRFFCSHSDRFSWHPPKAGSTGFPALNTGEDIGEFCDRVRRSSGVLLLPGTVFDWKEPHFRVGYGRKDMADVLGVFAGFFRDEDEPARAHDII